MWKTIPEYVLSNIYGVGPKKAKELVDKGIKDIDENDIDNANKLGYKIKLLGYAELINNKIYQRVHPTLIKKDSYVAGIDGVLNAVITSLYMNIVTFCNLVIYQIFRGLLH